MLFGRSKSAFAKGNFLHRPWALEWSLRLWGGKKILTDYFLSRSLSIGVPFADAMDVFQKIRSMEDWVRLWYRVGVRREILAKKAQGAGMHPSSTSFWMMARAAFHMAQFPFYQDPELKQKIYRRCAGAYLQAAPHLDPPARRIEIPFRSVRLPGYLRFPSEGLKEAVLVIFGGIDGVKEEMHYYGDYFVHRGFSVLYFDSPGLGESWERVKMDPDYPGLGRAVFDFLKNFKEVRFSKIGLLGLSLGGNMAIHVAASEVPVRSCVAISPPFHPRGYFDKLLFLIQQAAYHIIGGKGSLNDFMEMISLREVAGKVHCPLMVIGGAKDQILPGEEAHEVYHRAPEPKKLLFYPDATHGCPERTVEMFWEIEQWFRETLK